jgi:ribose 5-phosphate isomerase A
VTTINLKQMAAEAALTYLGNHSIIGVGTGSTVDYFIDALATIKHHLDVVVSSSKRSTERLHKIGLKVVDVNTVDTIPIYIDGADEINHHLQMIKGGGGALTSEKIIAVIAKKFICIADESKQVKLLGKFPVAVEVIPMARSYVAREIMKLNGTPVYREGFITDHSNVILDVHNLNLVDPLKMEQLINNITGVVENGIFATRTADVLLLGTKSGVKEIK